MPEVYKLKRYTLSLGEMQISVKEYKASRSMRAIVHSDGSVIITCPPRTPKIHVGRFAEQNAQWIRDAASRMLSKAGASSRYITSFKSRQHELEFQAYNGNYIKTENSAPKLLVKYPKTLDICSAEVQNAAYKLIVAALKTEAAEYVPKRMQQLAEANGLSFRGLTITSTRSRWGSCSSGKQIRISCFVMMLPSSLIDLVLLHELAHTVYMSHSEAFHIKLNSMLPQHNERELNKELYNYHITKPK